MQTESSPHAVRHSAAIHLLSSGSTSTPYLPACVTSQSTRPTI